MRDIGRGRGWSYYTRFNTPCAAVLLGLVCWCCLVNVAFPVIIALDDASRLECAAIPQ